MLLRLLRDYGGSSSVLFLWSIKVSLSVSHPCFCFFFWVFPTGTGSLSRRGDPSPSQPFNTPAAPLLERAEQTATNPSPSERGVCLEFKYLYSRAICDLLRGKRYSLGLHGQSSCLLTMQYAVGRLRSEHLQILFSTPEIHTAWVHQSACQGGWIITNQGRVLSFLTNHVPKVFFNMSCRFVPNIFWNEERLLILISL